MNDEKNPKHLVFVISSLRAGGAERVTATLARSLGQRMRVTIICLSAAEPPFYPVPDTVERIYLDRMGENASLTDAVRANLGRLRDLRKTLKQLSPQIIVSHMLETNVLTILAGTGLNTPVLVCEHTDPAILRHKLPWRLLRKLLYRLSDGVVVLNESMRRYFASIAPGKVNLIPNPVEVSFDPSFEAPEGPYVLGMGRLVDSKGFQHLIDAFARIAGKFPAWRLYIAGDGPSRNRLQAQIESLDLGDQVKLLGQSTRPHDLMRHAEFFASASSIEAFPMAICEAMACARPVVAYACNPDIKGLIGPDQGIVVNDMGNALAGALENLMSHEQLRKQMGQSAVSGMTQYGTAAVTDLWLETFNRTAGIGFPPVTGAPPA